MRIAYLDCFSGISGDMFLGALLDADLPLQVLDAAVAELNRTADLHARLELSRVTRNGIAAAKVDVWIGDEKDQPRLEHHRYQSHKHGHTHERAHEQVLGHEQHTHSHSHGGTAVLERTHSERSLREIREIILSTAIEPRAKERAIAIFEALGAAEAKIHDTDVEKIHFHEVGAADAIVDIVCAAVGAEALGVDAWICSPLNVGSGNVRCVHGEFPVPAPATAELLKDAPVFSSGIQAELVTPTGAAIVKVLAGKFAALPELKLSAIGYGAGTRDFDGHSNVLRLLVGTVESVTVGQAAEGWSDVMQETIAVLEANLDDLNPQIFGYLMEALIAKGALDVFYTPVQMKKNRPGMLLTVLANISDADRLAKVLFTETTTLGIRVRQEKRFVLARRWETVSTQWGDVRIKVANLQSASSHHTPEYEDCRRIAQEHQIPLKMVMQEASRLYLERNNG